MKKLGIILIIISLIFASCSSTNKNTQSSSVINGGLLGDSSIGSVFDGFIK